MADDIRDGILAFIVEEDAFFVMAAFRKFGVLTGEDIRKAIAMERREWIEFMLEKTGVADREEPGRFSAGEEVE